MKRIHILTALAVSTLFAPAVFARNPWLRTKKTEQKNQEMRVDRTGEWV